jgi:hypothetical protein
MALTETEMLELTPALWLDIDGRLYVLRYGFINYYQHTGVTTDLGSYESQGPVVTTRKETDHGSD